jgi:hypothetical protein
MPQSQVAAVQNYDFGAPATEDEVLKFRVKHGGELALRFEHVEGDTDGEVTVQVAPDGDTWADTTAAANRVAIANAAIPIAQKRDYTILLRAEEDAWMRVQAVGGCRMVMQVRADMNLEIEKI